MAYGSMAKEVAQKVMGKKKKKGTKKPKPKPGSY